MKKKRHNPAQIIRKLREAERMKADGKNVAEVCQALEISEQTFHRWKARYGGADSTPTALKLRIHRRGRSLLTAFRDRERLILQYMRMLAVNGR